ncbi:UDP-galactose transporter Gms1 [Diatrype stigma]|uniref:UDP-galactose transporter Gms1 n=1 Tax=Diatrype stigma TaxID=117547 RepID=A0AAN9YQ47_9PEZI
MALLDGPQPNAGGPTLFGLPMKQLTFQNSALILIMHYSRMMPPTGDHRYFPSTAVFLTEVIKLAISLTFAIYEISRSMPPMSPATRIFGQINKAVFSGDSWKLAIPATLYTLQNTLQYVGVGNLDPVHFQILYQLRILTTAIFTVMMLGRPLTPKRWIALIILTIGVSVVSIPPADSKDPSFIFQDMADHFFPRSVHELGQVTTGMGEVANHLTRRSATYEGIEDDQNLVPNMNYSIGLSAVLVAAVVSGLTGVYFEKVVKDPATSVSIWTRNIQLSFYSLFPALLVGIVYKDGEEIAQHGFFDGYNWVVWTLITLQACGGILASLCINYADNIAKNFATSISIIISFLFSVCFFDVKVTLTFFVGTIFVLLSTFLYSGPDRKRGRPPPIRIASFEKTAIESMNTPRYSDDRLSVPDPLEAVRSMGLSTSRPASPLRHHVRVPSARGRVRDE